MDIVSAQYVLNEITNNNQSAIDAVIDGKLAHVPIDPANRHYAEIMRQVEAGTLTIADAD